MRALTPVGVWESRRLPGSGAGVSPDRMLIGSEGTLGVITEAWVRVRPRPTHRASAPVRFAEFAAGADAVRALSQSGLYPTNCRLIDAREAEVTGAGDGSHALLVLGFESAGHDVERSMTTALEICGDHGGTWERRGVPRLGERRGRRQLARGVPARSLPARCVHSDRSAVRDVRDRDHLGAIPGVPRAGDRRTCRGASARCAAAGR